MQVGAGGVGGTVAPACIRDIDARRHFSCAVLTDGTGWCWGDNHNGQLGDGTQQDRNLPVQVSKLSNATAIVTASRMTYALLSGGSMAAWGLNDAGQFGDGSTVSSNLPVSVPDLTQLEEISAGRGHVCARNSSHDAYCWGWNDDGQIGDGMEGSSRTTPYEVLSTTQQICAGGRFSCALRDNDEVWCCYHGCIALPGNELLCVGYNGHGQLGIGATQNAIQSGTVALPCPE